MIAQCNVCRGDITYEPRQSGQIVGCPHCHKETRLPKPPVNWRKRIRNILFVLGPLIVVALVLLFVFVVGPFIDRFKFTGVEQGLVFVLTLFLLTVGVVLALAWLFFPILVVVKFNEVLREMVKKR